MTPEIRIATNQQHGVVYVWEADIARNQQDKFVNRYCL